jgi:hypothetical protein
MGETPLANAAIGGDINIYTAKLLLDYGANISLGVFNLHILSLTCQNNMKELLLRYNKE